MSSSDSVTATSQASPNGDAWNADTYNAVASFVYSKEFTTPVLGLLNARPGERILDLGCGSGDLTLVLKRTVGETGVVLGVDASENMVKKARQNGVTASFVADAQDLQLPPATPIDKEVADALPEGFDYKFDAVFSNAVLHWCKRDPYAVVRAVAKVLRKGGRFVGEMGGYLNTVGLRSSMHAVLRKRGLDPESLDPWYFPSTDEYRKVLESAGFRVTHISLNPRITPLSSDIIDWQRTFCRKTIFATLNDADAEEVMREVQDMCTIDSRDANGRWTVMYCRLRFVAILD
ncbi:S-adenosyl-L-methionine-dependent methyltransferase [Fomitiporia mediterranea MF3/22]|uniref:S-adenosyl-L-methionine-dependent methyltransferase n=1 Tax=Fomitiporia mediterranea (strain MF3/22) TaxID=694068 RepID=UPI0004409C46|nr:S-adenosyl-L-methionine-dependent methyltransferase [Fomitiporia mediterranea MF3/22]EJC98010.1 S-adenosyl-L-methionine-dependent methyltransferase [Fomitiporia mediterranea MF3/22]